MLVEDCLSSSQIVFPPYQLLGTSCSSLNLRWANAKIDANSYKFANTRELLIYSVATSHKWISSFLWIIYWFLFNFMNASDDSRYQADMETIWLSLHERLKSLMNLWSQQINSFKIPERRCLGLLMFDSFWFLFKVWNLLKAKCLKRQARESQPPMVVIDFYFPPSVCKRIKTKWVSA